ncbi:DUF5630 domain-containing protein [Legionella brunensis]|uniref:Ankyrin repeat protein n=1 Tax=Legionella brunensis TaxID=29422 RepID=A0A0W0SV93_9GAMM|nr:DUF5630 domain-containing protein [Legionella brunensis]KTC87196.1 Ankyrin repeat protein [Legionella brunensis]
MSNLPKLRDLTQLNAVDFLFIRNLRTHNAFNEEEFFKQVKVDDLSFIIRISKESNYFNTLCKQSKYKKLWDVIYSQIGLYLTAKETTPISFFVHDDPNLDSFSLAKGAYLFYLYDLLRQEPGADYTPTKIKLLKEAVNLKSIHATQHYNQFLFYKIEHNDLEPDEDKRTLFKEAIANCKQELELYGSYAYMMLVETYFHYAKWAASEGNSDLVIKAIEAAQQNCSLAKKHLEKSTQSIHNASLGRGLAFSNSFNVESPDEAKVLLQQWLEKNYTSQSAPRV